MLTGVTDGARLLAARPEHRPTFVDADLRGLLTGQPEVGGEDGRFTCGGWTASADGEFALDGDGEAMDGLRALCAAAWSRAGDGVCELDAAKVLARLGL
ncbi:hypothetical protein DWB77_05941 [Streptomyces hundungensis]|uniref:GCN5-related N-acetyltransferase-like domain-containing protein n=1 Tax=Streptomyces hundungensis TaxID=1077946 RepID=A0A387HQS7_9ACTN|nr:hypothetical protein DWB77_05941 [Streptomyces hundungensis]